MQKQAKEVNRLKVYDKIKENGKKAVDKVKSIFKPNSTIIQKNEQTPSKNTGRNK